MYYVENIPAIYIAHQVQVPFDKYFKVEPLSKYHRVLLMEEFMQKIAPMLWPQERRIGKY